MTESRFDDVLGRLSTQITPMPAVDLGLSIGRVIEPLDPLPSRDKRSYTVVELLRGGQSDVVIARPSSFEAFSFERHTFGIKAISDDVVAVKIVALEGSSASVQRSELRLLMDLANYAGGVVPVLAAERLGEGVAGIVMPYFIRGSLRNALRQGTMSLRQRIAVWAQVATTVAFIRKKSPHFVHGDLKPENILLDLYGDEDSISMGVGGYLIDFGLSVVSPNSGRGGTPFYMAPELHGGGSPTPQSDVYALGVLLFEIVHDRLPFSGSTVGEYDRNATRLPFPEVPSVVDWPWLTEVIQKSLAVRPEDRIPDVLEFARRVVPMLLAAGAPKAFPPSAIPLWPKVASDASSSKGSAPASLSDSAPVENLGIKIDSRYREIDSLFALFQAGDAAGAVEAARQWLGMPFARHPIVRAALDASPADWLMKRDANSFGLWINGLEKEKPLRDLDVFRPLCSVYLRGIAVWYEKICREEGSQVTPFRRIGPAFEDAWAIVGGFERFVDCLRSPSFPGSGADGELLEQYLSETQIVYSISSICVLKAVVENDRKRADRAITCAIKMWSLLRLAHSITLEQGELIDDKHPFHLMSRYRVTSPSAMAAALGIADPMHDGQFVGEEIAAGLAVRYNLEKCGVIRAADVIGDAACGDVEYQDQIRKLVGEMFAVKAADAESRIVADNPVLLTRTTHEFLERQARLCASDAQFAHRLAWTARFCRAKSVEAHMFLYFFKCRGDEERQYLFEQSALMRSADFVAECDELGKGLVDIPQDRNPYLMFGRRLRDLSVARALHDLLTEFESGPGRVPPALEAAVDRYRYLATADGARHFLSFAPELARAWRKERGIESIISAFKAGLGVRENET